MLEIVAERGYGIATVRELAQVAKVSSRAFYQNYSGKEECFLCTHEAIARRIDRRVSVAQHGVLDWRKCLHLTIGTYLRELEREPHAARLLLIDAYVAGLSALEQVRCAERALEMRLVACIDLATDGLALPSLVTRGIAGGLICVARSRFAKGQERQLISLTDDLTAWASAVFAEVLSNARISSSDPESHSSYTSIYENHLLSWPAVDERSLIVLALTKLVAVEKYDELTMRKIRDSSGASRKKFSAHFTDAADCFENAVEHYGVAIISRLAEERHERGDAFHGADWMAPMVRVCQRAANDVAFARLCFADIFGPGRSAVECLDRIIEELKAILAEGAVRASGSAIALEVSAAAVWAALREEILAGRRTQLIESASHLQVLAPRSSRRDRKQTASEFDHLSPRRDAHDACGAPAPRQP
jgi:AcrR family transcriptional regulator